jgi:hypothetical protein|tara:strand:+ start:334 stop:678 length:345 start_codon:yes stop_codon:yes gene_type:complete
MQKRVDFYPGMVHNILVNERGYQMLIDYVSANNGGLQFFGEAGDAIWCEVGYGKTAAECQEIISENGLSDQVMASSSMDFASEYGFASNDDANAMYYEAIKNCSSDNWKGLSAE